MWYTNTQITNNQTIKCKVNLRDLTTAWVCADVPEAMLVRAQAASNWREGLWQRKQIKLWGETSWTGERGTVGQIKNPVKHWCQHLRTNAFNLPPQAANILVHLWPSWSKWAFLNIVKFWWKWGWQWTRKLKAWNLSWDIRGLNRIWCNLPATAVTCEQKSFPPIRIHTVTEQEPVNWLFMSTSNVIRHFNSLWICTSYSWVGFMLQCLTPILLLFALDKYMGYSASPGIL